MSWDRLTTRVAMAGMVTGTLVYAALLAAGHPEPRNVHAGVVALLVNVAVYVVVTRLARGRYVPSFRSRRLRHPVPERRKRLGGRAAPRSPDIVRTSSRVLGLARARIDNPDIAIFGALDERGPRGSRRVHGTPRCDRFCRLGVDSRFGMTFSPTPRQCRIRRL